jgi:hypothetical protein
MPTENHFRHQPYHPATPEAPFEVFDAPAPTDPSTTEFNDSLVAACQPWGKANVAGVLLIHGTFVGNDALGILTELRRVAPGLSEGLRKISKKLVDVVIGETGNYTPGFAQTFQEGLTQAAGRVIPVELFNWSSQNNHIARADGAIRLIARLAKLADEFTDEQFDSETPPRVMLWAHSHGGNLLAIVTNLLAANHEVRKLFFDAARVFYTPWLTKRADMPAWVHVEKLLETDARVRRLPLDIVTYGTPIRYGWDSRGYGNLLHFVNHRASERLPEHRTHPPSRLLDAFSAKHGDYVHQVGIAGTNVMPLPLAVRTYLADQRLRYVLQSDATWQDLWKNFAHGQRVPDEGPTLLVDYHDAGWDFWRHLWGHGAYTRRCWLPFHVDQISQRFYGNTVGNALCGVP